VCFAYPSAFESESNVRLSERLAEEAGPGLERAFFVSSGSEAVEKCLQFARRYALAKRPDGALQVISRNPSYHGSTRATMALSADPGYAAYLAPGPHGHPRSGTVEFTVRPQAWMPPGTPSSGAEAFRPHESWRKAQKKCWHSFIEPVMGFCGGAGSMRARLLPPRARDLR